MQGEVNEGAAWLRARALLVQEKALHLPLAAQALMAAGGQQQHKH